MTDLFSTLLEQSLTACWVIPAVLLLRFCLKKAPKRITNLLWLVVAFRLICPVSFESNVSLVTQAENLSHAAAELQDEVETLRPSQSAPTVTLPGDMVFVRPVTPVEPLWPETPSVPVLPETPEVPEIIITPEETPREQPFVSRQLVLRAGCGIWLAGLAAMALFGLLSTRQWRKRVQTAVRCEDGLWRSESVESPFILGVLRPKIYLPFVLPFGAESHVIAHEQAHLKRRDPLWKCFAFALLSVYWFHPLVWVSYFLFCRDIELACDQQVTRNLDAEGKKAYSRALLACTVSRDPLLCPLSFGEVGVKARVKAVLQKKPSQVFTFTALVLCTVLIICCAANPKEEHPWDEAYRQTLEDLLKQYGANEDYGLQSVTTLDLWEDGVPELVVFRKGSENADFVMLYEYNDGQATLRFSSSVSHIYQSYHVGSGQLLWKQTENGPCFASYTQNNDTSKYANRQCLKVITLFQQLNSEGHWTADTDRYYEMYDGRGYRDDGSVTGESKAVFIEEAERDALFSDWVDLSERDLDGFIRRHWGARSYYQAYLTVLEEKVGYSRNVLLVDMELDGIPELLTDDNGTVLLYQYDQTDRQAKLLYSWPVAEGQYYWLDMTEPYPVLVVELHGDTQERFAVAASDGSQFRTGMLNAKGSHKSHRSWLSNHTATGDFFGKNAGLLSADDYESLRISLLENADRYNPHEEIFGTGTGINSILHSLESASLDSVAPKEKTTPPMEYTDVLRALIAQYGMFHVDEKTDFVLGLKYAGLHKLKYDSTPSLVTLVNTRDADGVFHMTLRVYRAEESGVSLLYETELGNRYGQTDVSHTFHVGREIITYHSSNEWTEEVIHIYDPSNGTRVLRAVTNGQNGAPTRDALEQFWLDGEAISWGHYTMETVPVLQDSTEYDACWDVAPASRADLEGFLSKMGVTVDAAPAGYGETVAAAHHSRLSGLMTVHGTTPDGIVGATIVDLEQDGVPELLVQHGMNLELYRYENSQSRLIWSGKIGLYFGQSDVSHQYVINTHIEQPCIIVYDAEESWTEEVLRVIALNDGVVSEEVLRAWTYDKTAFFPEWENLNQFTINDKAVSDIKYNRRREEVLDGGMTVSAVHPHAYPNSDAYMADLLNQLSAGNLPEIGDSATRAVAWWLMSTNDGEPLDEQTALKFGDAFAYSAESPLGSFPDSLLIGPSGGTFDFCRYTLVDGQFWLILIDREDTTLVCEGVAYRFDENGALRVGTGFLNVDTFSASLVGGFDGQTLVHRRYHTDCYSGMEGCEDCFRSDLVLWNADRTEYVKLIENAPLANHFKVVSREKNIVTVTYQTGPAHSEYNEVVTGQVDLAKKTFTRLSVMPLGHTHGETAVQDGVSYQAAIGEISPQLRELFRAVLANEADFIFVPDQQTMMLQDMEHRNLFTCFTVLDMEDDGVPELIIQEEGPYFFKILRYDNGLFFCYDMPYRGMMDLKADGTYCFSSGHQDHGIGKASFTEQGMETNKLIWCQSVPTVNDVFPTKCEWFANGEPATEEDLTKAYDSRAYLEEVRWYAYNDETIEQLFAPAASNPQLKQYDQVRFEKYPDGRMGERFALIRKGDYWGLADGNLEIILEPERYALEAIQLSTYEEVWPILPVQKDGCWGAIDYYGNMVIEPEWNYIQMFIYNEPKQVFVHDGEQWRSIKLTYASYTDVFTYKGLSAGEPNPELTVSDGLRAEMESIEEYLIQN